MLAGVHAGRDSSSVRGYRVRQLEVHRNNWRRGRDSNPRQDYSRTRFPSVLLRPLGHLSARPSCIVRRATAILEKAGQRPTGVRPRPDPLPWEEGKRAHAVRPYVYSIQRGLKFTRLWRAHPTSPPDCLAAYGAPPPEFATPVQTRFRRTSPALEPRRSPLRTDFQLETWSGIISSNGCCYKRTVLLKRRCGKHRLKHRAP